MLSIAHIQHLLQARSYERLIDRVLTNGRSGNLALRLRLTRPEAAAPAALGLALQRVCELTYGPTATAAHLSARLIGMQVDGGLFGGDGAEFQHTDAIDDTSMHRFAAPEPVEASTAASSVALRGLIEFRRLRAETGRVADPLLDAAITRGLFAFAARQREGGSIGRDAVEDAIILWQLGDVAMFREAIRFAELREALDSAGEGAVANDLARLAHAMAA